MSDPLSAFIVSIYAAVIGSGGMASGSEADAKPDQAEASQAGRQARTNVKHLQQNADAVYKAAIADCRKKPSLERHACLENARAINDRAILEARAADEKAVVGVTADYSAKLSYGVSRSPHGLHTNNVNE